MSAAALPELAAVPWRPRADAARAAQRAALWTLTTIAHVVPFVADGGAARARSARCRSRSPRSRWRRRGSIPELYAAPRRERRAPSRAGGAAARPERTALGLLGDLVGHDARALHARTGLVLERGRLGVWLVGEAGALLVGPAAAACDCWCVRVAGPDAALGDRIAHLLLALREDEAGFATVANLAFAGARWRVRRRLPPRCARRSTPRGARDGRPGPPVEARRANLGHAAKGAAGPEFQHGAMSRSPSPRPAATCSSATPRPADHARAAHALARLDLARPRGRRIASRT